MGALTILRHVQTFSFKYAVVQKRVNSRQPHDLCWVEGFTWIVVMLFSLNSATGCFPCRCSLTWIRIWIKPFLTQGWLSKNTWMSSLNIWWAACFFFFFFLWVLVEIKFHRIILKVICSLYDHISILPQSMRECTVFSSFLFTARLLRFRHLLLTKHFSLVRKISQYPDDLFSTWPKLFPDLFVRSSSAT